jgi:hypothetical protein
MKSPPPSVVSRPGLRRRRSLMAEMIGVLIVFATLLTAGFLLYTILERQ